MSEIGTSLTSAAEYAMLMRVPLITGVALLTLPWLATRAGVRGLLLGLFDVTPPSLIAVTLAATSVAGIVVDNSRVIYLHSRARGIGGLLPPTEAAWWVWVVLAALLSLPVVGFTVYFSDQQNKGKFAQRIGWASLSWAFASGLQAAIAYGCSLFTTEGWLSNPFRSPLLNGYFPLTDHITAAAGFAMAIAIYAGMGYYGLKRLGKFGTVPALCSGLMLMMLVCSSLSALSFLLDLWHVPVLLIVLGVGLIMGRVPQSDHFYDCVEKSHSAVSAPTPIETLRANDGRVVVVAANGGGIQAAAWTARVLEGLCELQAQHSFARSLRLISSVSGGSLGSACYTYRQANGEKARAAADAASRSSLDEVAWGLAWPDFIRSLFPFFGRDLIGRGRALERAWIANCSNSESSASLLDKPLSDWNDEVRQGNLPAVIMNATLCETGQRLLFGTTCFSGTEDGRARVDATTLHKGKDVAAVTAARLSASFPYVTPASRSNLDGIQPHVVDGGYYDNYGMSTLVEWLDEGLEADAQEGHVKSVLVIQIHGSPVDTKPVVKRNQGWFFQTLAPVTTLNTVRGAGQLAHNDIELQQLQKYWFERKVPIHSVTFEYPDEDAPLSWHLTSQQQKNIDEKWKSDRKIESRREQVMQFLNGSDRIQCPCPACNPRLTPQQVKKRLLRSFK